MRSLKKNGCWRSYLDLICSEGALLILLASMIPFVISDASRPDKRVQTGVCSVESLKESGPTKPVDLIVSAASDGVPLACHKDGSTIVDVDRRAGGFSQLPLWHHTSSSFAWKESRSSCPSLE